MKPTIQARRAQLASTDGALLAALALLLCGGLVMVYSASIAGDRATLQLNFAPLVRHALHIGMGAALLFGAARMPLHWWQKLARPLLLLSLLALVLVLVPSIGKELNGARRWLSLGGVSVQPSEIAKVAAVLYFADYFARKREQLQGFHAGILYVGAAVAVIVGLLVLEPDYGSAFLIVAVAAAMMFLAGVNFWQFVATASAAAAVMTWGMMQADYRMQRLTSFLDPWQDAYRDGYQLTQSLIAVGRGEWFGSGLGASIQKLFYLPHAGTDFLVAVIAEELGAVGIFCVLILYVVLLWRAFVIGARALQQGEYFGGFLAQGIGLLLAVQAGIHIGVNIGILPTKGLTLPLMSYGGSSMLCAMAAVGILFSVDRRVRMGPDPRRTAKVKAGMQSRAARKMPPRITARGAK